MMKQILICILLLMSVVVPSCSALITSKDPECNNNEKFIVVVIASYNNARWCTWNLDSVFKQNYSNYHVMYMDDGSIDGTSDCVARYIQENGVQDYITVVTNPQRLGSAIANQYRAISMVEDEAIIVILDGDDALAHPDVFAYLNRVYQDGTIWMTYGQFLEWPQGIVGFCHDMPVAVVRKNSFRYYQDIPSHLRTFYAKLFKKINVEHLMYEGEFMRMTGDMAAMIPMIEMASCGHFKFIPDILCLYNTQNPINDHKVSVDLQRKLDRYIRALPRYEPLDVLFEE